MPVFSNFAKHAYRSGLREAQDILVDCDDVDLIHLEATERFTTKERWMMRLVYHDVSKKLVSFNPGLQRVHLKKDYDLFVLVCPWWRDVWYANAIQGWRDHCRTSVCWIDELWANDIPQLEYWLPILANFDHVIVGIEGSGRPLSDAIGRKCYEMPGGVDAIRFSPFPNPPTKVIDVYSIGRRIEGIHRVLLNISASKSIFYVHDTLQTGDSQAANHQEHRNMYARMAKRSRFFMVAPGKMNVSDQTAGQIDIGYRYFEASAAGAVMLGQAPPCELFRQHFDWPDAVIEINPDGSDVAKVIENLSNEPERIHQIGNRNSEKALIRHDWVYRWKEVLTMAGLKTMPAMDKREKRLLELAELAQNGVH
jgi:spore maturation protein CgeB